MGGRTGEGKGAGGRGTVIAYPCAWHFHPLSIICVQLLLVHDRDLFPIPNIAEVRALNTVRQGRRPKYGNTCSSGMPHAVVCDAIRIFRFEGTRQCLAGGVAFRVVNIGKITTTADIVQITRATLNAIDATERHSSG